MVGSVNASGSGVDRSTQSDQAGASGSSGVQPRNYSAIHRAAQEIGTAFFDYACDNLSLAAFFKKLPPEVQTFQKNSNHLSALSNNTLDLTNAANPDDALEELSISQAKNLENCAIDCSRLTL